MLGRFNGSVAVDYRGVYIWLQRSQLRCSQTMNKPLATSVRFSEEIKAALTQAAADDTRSQSSMIEKIVTDWLKSNGYLKPKAKAR